MSTNKKYYWLKLKDNFFDSDEMILLQSMQDGYLYSDILLKMYLKSLKTEGRLMLKEHIPYNSSMIATITRHTAGTVDKALEMFIKLGLIEILDNKAIYMLDIQSLIGEGSSEGDRKKEYREKIKKEQSLLIERGGQMSDFRPPEIEIDKEKEIEKEFTHESEHSRAHTFVKDCSIGYKSVQEYCLNRFGKELRRSRQYLHENYSDISEYDLFDFLDNRIKTYEQMNIDYLNTIAGSLNEIRYYSE